jgi:hypothetical protein
MGCDVRIGTDSRHKQGSDKTLPSKYKDESERPPYMTSDDRCSADPNEAAEKQARLETAHQISPLLQSLPAVPGHSAKHSQIPHTTTRREKKKDKIMGEEKRRVSSIDRALVLILAQVQRAQYAMNRGKAKWQPI